MCNTTIAKTKLQKLKSRTQRDIYHLKHESESYTPLNEDVLHVVREISKENNLPCPLYKWGGDIRLKKDLDNFYKVLDVLANDHSIFFNLKENLK